MRLAWPTALPRCLEVPRPVTSDVLGLIVNPFFPGTEFLLATEDSGADDCTL